MGEAAPHLHGDVSREDQQAERLDALGQAAGRLPGGQAVAHVRGARERGRGLNEGQSQDQENGEAQNPGKGTETGQQARTSHAQGPREQASRRDAWEAAGQTPRVRRPGPTSCSGATRAWSDHTHRVQTQVPQLAGRFWKGALTREGPFLPLLW